MAQVELQPLAKLKQRILKILRKYGVVRAGVFGSYARGDNSERSDVDLLVEFAPGAKLGFNVAALELELEEELGLRVDLIFYDTIHPLLRKRILAEEVRILE